MWFPSSYWDSSYDDDVMEHRVGLNLLYVQVRVGAAWAGGQRTPVRLCGAVGAPGPAAHPPLLLGRRCQTSSMDGSSSTRSSTGS